jgi:hypothetical protein
MSWDLRDGQICRETVRLDGGSMLPPVPQPPSPPAPRPRRARVTNPGLAAAGCRCPRGPSACAGSSMSPDRDRLRDVLSGWRLLPREHFSASAMRAWEASSAMPAASDPGRRSRGAVVDHVDCTAVRVIRRRSLLTVQSVRRPTDRGQDQSAEVRCITWAPPTPASGQGCPQKAATGSDRLRRWHRDQPGQARTPRRQDRR